MTPSLIENDGNIAILPPTKTQTNSTTPPSLLHRSLHHFPQRVISARGNYLTLSTGQRILDATGGAAVACLGHGDPRVATAVANQMSSFSYAHTLLFTSSAAEDLARFLTNSTGGEMSKAFIVSSGSEAMEAALKLARQYFVEKGEVGRVHFVSRRESYHGNTLGALGVSGHVARRKVFEPLLCGQFSRVSAANAYRGMREGESEEGYVKRLAEELEGDFQRLGGETVCAFVAEPVVGAALGCVPAPKGYFKAVRKVCDRYGVLLILDEVMSGMGRTGYLHAWQCPDVGVVPDIQTIGKGLGGGYAAVAGLLINNKVISVLDRGTGAFSHGQTYQGHPVACAAALEVQKIIQEKNLVENARRMGIVLERLLKERLELHPYVGDIRGRGLFWGIEFVKDKATKTPFDPYLGVAMGLHERALKPPYSISLYPGTGTVDGILGDHVLIAPAYNVTEADVELMVDLTVGAIEEYFSTSDLQ